MNSSSNLRDDKSNRKYEFEKQAIIPAASHADY